VTLTGTLAANDEFNLVADGITIASGAIAGANSAALIADLASKLFAAKSTARIASITESGSTLVITYTTAAGAVAANATLTQTKVAGVAR
jgi:hypothetical protein